MLAVGGIAVALGGTRDTPAPARSGAAPSATASPSASPAAWAAAGAFYTPPRDVPSEPGRLIRSERFTRDVPDGAEGWRILYTTTRGDGAAAVASALVVAPTAGTGPWPVIDWAHGTTGYAPACAPSLAAHPFEEGGLDDLSQVIAAGWAVVATDYIGLGTAGPQPYLIGPDTAHAVLDAARAARELGAAHLGSANVVWGHSQGGNAALWAGDEAAQYAPDLELDGVAALAPASDLSAVAARLPDIDGGLYGAYVVTAYSATYGDVGFDRYIRPDARTLVRAAVAECPGAGEDESAIDTLEGMPDSAVFSASPDSGPIAKRLAQNVPPADIGAPLLIAQGEADTLVLPAMQDAYVDRLCAAGQRLDYRRYRGRDHLTLVEGDSPLISDLVAWTRARFAGAAVPAGCTRSER